jgi:translation initiation factor eIF-2B subunit alpha
MKQQKLSQIEGMMSMASSSMSSSVVGEAPSPQITNQFGSDISRMSTVYNLELYQASFDYFCDYLDKQDNKIVTQALIQGLGHCIQQSESKTQGGILQELNNAIEFFTKKAMGEEEARFKSKFTIKALTAIYLRMVKKELGRSGVTGDIRKVKENIKIRTEGMAKHSVKCIDLITKYAQNVLRDGMTLMVHSKSRSVFSVLKSAAESGVRVQVITTECLPHKFGQEVMDFCSSVNIPCKMVLDSSIGFCMSQVDCVLVGAEAVLENGGIVNRIGTLTIAMCAKAYNKPFYVFADSLKFLKRFPLQQSDIFAILDEDTKVGEQYGGMGSSS